MWSSYEWKIVFQVPFFLFIIFTVYTMLPFQLLHAVVLSVISSVSHIMVLTLRLTIYSETHTPYLANQVKTTWIKTIPLCCFTQYLLLPRFTH